MNWIINTMIDIAKGLSIKKKTGFVARLLLFSGVIANLVINFD